MHVCIFFLYTIASRLRNFLQNNRRLIVLSSLSTRPLPSRPNGFLISNDAFRLQSFCQRPSLVRKGASRRVREDSFVPHLWSVNSVQRQWPPCFRSPIYLLPSSPCLTLVSVLATNIRSYSRCPQVKRGRRRDRASRNARSERCIVRRQAR